ncbi:MAG: carboxylesterase [Planctomycetes bacterium]|nr:carboxylesterase [Planctomycetota bacterium]
MSVDPYPCVEVEWGPASRDLDGVVVWLHGLGADGHDFEPIVPELHLPTDRRLRFVFPHAPIRPVTLNQGYEMRAWYDILGMEFRRDEDEAGIRSSEQLVRGIIERESTPVGAERVVLAGFSQGGAMAYHVGLRYPERLAGILVLSGYLLLEPQLIAEASPANRDTPILQCHGLYDPVVPISMGEHSARHLDGLGYEVDWRTYEVMHGVHPHEVRDIGTWLADRLPRRSDD